MLPVGPRSTFPLPPTPQAGSRDLARQILASIKAEIKSASEVRVGTVSTGCDGLPTINPLNGTTCSSLPGGSPGSACDLVLYNPSTRSVLTHNVGRALAGNGLSCQLGSNVFIEQPPASDRCAKMLAKLRKRRRFVDNLGNWYGPDGAWLSYGHAAATLGTDYVHRVFTEGAPEEGVAHDPEKNVTWPNLYLEKTVGVPRVKQLWHATQGLRWPSPNDLSIAQSLGVGSTSAPGHVVATQTKDAAGVAGLNDLRFGGVYTEDDLPSYWVKITNTGTPNKFDWGMVPGVAIATNVSIDRQQWQALNRGIEIRFGANTGHTLNDLWTMALGAPTSDAVMGASDLTASGTCTTASRWWIVEIDSLGTTGVSADTFKWWSKPMGETTHLNVPPDTPAATLSISGFSQSLSFGISIRFAATTGHTLGDSWGVEATNLDVIRYGVAVRGIVDGVTVPSCDSVIPVNSNVLMTAEATTTWATHPYGGNRTNPTSCGPPALVVRDPDTLAILYRKALQYDANLYTWGDPPQLFSFSTTEEGRFFAHLYTAPSLTSPPTPFPGHELGSPNPRKVAVVFVDPLTFEPTIEEIITLEDNGATIGSTFVVAFTE